MRMNVNGMGLTDDFITFSVCMTSFMWHSKWDSLCSHIKTMWFQWKAIEMAIYRTKPHRNNATYTTHSNSNSNTNARARTHECVVYTTAVMSSHTRSVNILLGLQRTSMTMTCNDAVSLLHITSKNTHTWPIYRSNGATTTAYLLF